MKQKQQKMTERITFRLTPAERQEVERLAKLKGMMPSEFIRYWINLAILRGKIDEKSTKFPY